MRIFQFLLRSSRGLLLPAIVIGLISGLCSTGLIGLIHTALSRGDIPRTTLLWSFIGLCVLTLLAGIASKLLLVRIGQRSIMDLRMHLSRQILSASLSRLEEVGTHRLLLTLTDDVLTITNSIVTVPLICINLAIVSGCVVYLGWLSPVLLVVVLGLMGIGVITYQGPMVIATKYLKKARGEHDSLYKLFQALCNGTKELKLHERRRHSFLNDFLNPATDRVRQRTSTGLSIFTAAGSWGELLIFIIIGILLFAAPAMHGFSFQTLSGFTLIVLYMMMPIGTILFSFPVLARAQVALQKIETLGLSLELNGDEAIYLKRSQSAPEFKSLELDSVTRSYRTDGDINFVLGPIDLSFRPGEIVILAGGNGSGKTTLAKILCGLYVPESGQILLNGRAVTDNSRELYRQLFSVVFSDFYLFDSLMGLDKGQIDDQAREYLEALQLQHKVRVGDGVFSTTALSQGQRKRLALLTACLEDRPIYIFDEWAADQDPQFKELFYLSFLPELKAKGKLLLVISHDDRYYHLADRLIRLDYGKVETADKRLSATAL